MSTTDQAREALANAENMRLRSGNCPSIAKANAVEDMRKQIKEQGTLVKQLEVALTLCEEQLVQNQQEIAQEEKEKNRVKNNVEKEVDKEAQRKTVHYQNQSATLKEKLADERKEKEKLEKQIKDMEKKAKDAAKKVKAEIKERVEETKQELENHHTEHTKAIEQNFAQKVLDLESQIYTAKQEGKLLKQKTLKNLKDTGQYVQRFEGNSTSNESNLDRNLRDRVYKFKGVLKNVPADVLVASIMSISQDQQKLEAGEGETLFESIWKSEAFDKERLSSIKQAHCNYSVFDPCIFSLLFCLCAGIQRTK